MVVVVVVVVAVAAIVVVVGSAASVGRSGNAMWLAGKVLMAVSVSLLAAVASEEESGLVVVVVDVAEGDAVRGTGAATVLRGLPRGLLGGADSVARGCAMPAADAPRKGQCSA